MGNFKSVSAKRYLYEDKVGYVELWDASHANDSHEDRADVCSTIASLSYGNEAAKNPMELYKRLISIGHHSVLEFIRIGDYGMMQTLRNSWLPTKEDIGGSSAKFAVFKIKCPIFVARQFMRHRSLSYLEMSRRYVKGSKVPFEFFGETEGLSDFHLRCLKEYEARTIDGQAPEKARGAIPVESYTEFWVGGNVWGWATFFASRIDTHAQYEIRVLATEMNSLISVYQPEMHERLKTAIESARREIKNHSSSLLNQLG